MCGILGWVTDTPSALAGGFDAMLSALGHRGPDDRGERVLAGGRVHLGHTRLAIIDLSGAGRQPMSNEDDSVWLVFNGEIYNHRALRPELEARGHRFKSRTDSEVILHAYEQWGDDCVARLRGIFAFAIWDERGQRLLAARDRLGVKPFYYWRYPGGFVFASEPKAILEHPRFERRLSMPAFQTFLAHRYVPGDLAIFDGMAKLPAAHRLTLEDQRLALEAYWQLDVTQRVTKADEAAELIAARLEAAVQRQLVSDAPVGILLSGGLDSSTVTALAVTKSALPTFTIGFEETSSDERQFARATREFFGCPGHERIVTLDDAVRWISAFVDVCDEPFFDHSIIPTLALHELVRDHGVKVVLSGDGGDELFAGYRWYDAFFAEPPQSRRSRIRRWFSGRAHRRQLEIYFKYMGYFSADSQSALLSGASADFDPLALYRRFFREDLPTITALQLLDLKTFLVDDVLVKLDRASMAYGIEARVPLLDEDLVEAAFSIDHRLIYGGERKALMKRAVAKRLPPHIVTGRKKGFSVPLAEWTAGRLGPTIAGFVREGCLVNRGVFRAEAVARTLDQGKPSEAWMLFVAEAWARRWLEGQSSPVIEGALLAEFERPRSSSAGGVVP